jgi:hypothetical protein
MEVKKQAILANEYSTGYSNVFNLVLDVNDGINVYRPKKVRSMQVGMQKQLRHKKVVVEWLTDTNMCCFLPKLQES